MRPLSFGTAEARRRLLQVLLGLLWLADGLLQLQPFMFSRDFIGQVILPAASGNPGVVSGPMHALAAFVEPHLAVWNALFAAVQVAIGLGLLMRWSVRPALVVSFVWALFVWWFGEGFGGLLTGAASPLTGAPGAVLLYLMVGVFVWPRRADLAPKESAAAGGLLGERGARVAWAVLWLSGAALLLSPVNRYGAALASVVIVNGQSAALPAGIANAIWNLAVTIGIHGTPIDLVLSLVMGVVGVGVALRRGDRVLLAVAVVLALAIWLLGEGLGDILTGQATDPNSGPLLLLAALALYRPRRTATLERANANTATIDTTGTM